MAEDRLRVGIVGAGISGLACADRLTRHGIASELFDKGSRPGGRLSTLQLGSRAWDFGAQFVEAPQGDFAEEVERWRSAGVIDLWPGGPDNAWVGIPSMASLVGHLAERHAVRFSARVDSITRVSSRWILGGPDLAAGPFDAVVLAIPAEQAAPLLSLHDLHQAREAAAVRSRPCWSVMVAFAAPLAGPDFLQGTGPLSWAARNSSKPGRPDEECWVLHASPAWSERNLERDREEVAADILAAFAALVAEPLPEVTFLKAHRWRFAECHGHASQPLWNPRLMLGACGDWTLGPRIADAWQAGTDLADRIAESLGAERSVTETEAAK